MGHHNHRLRCSNITALFSNTLHYILTTRLKFKSKTQKILHTFQGCVSKFVTFCFVVFFLSTFGLFALNNRCFSPCSIVLHEHLKTLNLVTKVKYIPYVSVQDRGLRRRHAPGCGTKLCQTLQLPEGVRTQRGAGLLLMSLSLTSDLQNTSKYHQIQLFTSSCSLFLHDSFTRKLVGVNI